MRPYSKRRLLAALMGAGLGVAMLTANADPAAADPPATMHASVSSLAFPRLIPGVAAEAIIDLTIDPGYSYLSNFQTDFLTSDGYAQALSVDDADCTDYHATAAHCAVYVDTWPQEWQGAGSPTSLTVTMRECTAGFDPVCADARIPVTFGPDTADRFVPALPSTSAQLDFVDVPIGTSATHDVPIRPDSGFSFSRGLVYQYEDGHVDPDFPYHWQDNDCHSGTPGDCTGRIVYSPTAPTVDLTRGYAFNAEECRGAVCVFAQAGGWVGYGNTVDRASTTSALSASAGSSTYGAPVTLTGRVSSPSSVPVSGSVHFTDGGVDLGTAPLNATGVATLTVSNLMPGSHQLTASYPGTTHFAASTSAAVTVSVAFDRCVTGGSGAVTVHASEAVCVHGSHVGSVTVARGGALVISGATVIGTVTATGPAGLMICDSDVGAVRISGATGRIAVGTAEASCRGNHVLGGVTVSANTAGVTIAGNNIIGPLNCTANVPAPGDDGRHNSVVGSRGGQCSAAGF
jgi:hypothetical protein